MSQENVEALRASTAAFQRGEWEEAPAYLGPDVVWEVGRNFPWAAQQLSRSGRAGMSGGSSST